MSHATNFTKPGLVTHTFSKNMQYAYHSIQNLKTKILKAKIFCTAHAKILKLRFLQDAWADINSDYVMKFKIKFRVD